jgi:hypothetical protein
MLKRACLPCAVGWGIVVEDLRLKEEAWVEVEAEIVVFLTKRLRDLDFVATFGMRDEWVMLFSRERCREMECVGSSWPNSLSLSLPLLGEGRRD